MVKREDVVVYNRSMMRVLAKNHNWSRAAHFARDFLSQKFLYYNIPLPNYNTPSLNYSTPLLNYSTLIHFTVHHNTPLFNILHPPSAQMTCWLTSTC